MMHTANYRGHVGFWTVIEKRLYLKKLLVRGSDPEDPFSLVEFGLSRIFDETLTEQGRFADWFTGSILLRVGAYEKPLDDGTYAILYRQYRILEFTKGLLVKEHSMTGEDHRKAAPELREEGKELSVHGRLLKAHYDAQRSE